ncbi:MAG: phosphatase [Lachnospirales bacterium]
MQLKIDAHVHTISSGHAYSTINDYILQSKKIGLEGIAITDHAPNMPGSCGIFHFNNLHILPKFVEGVRIYTGIEANILSSDGDIDATSYTLQKLDIRIASLHDVLAKIDGVENVTKAYVNTMKNNYINVIGHPCDVRYPFDLEKVVLTAKEFNVALEVNNTSMNKSSYRYDPKESIIELLKLCEKHKVYIMANSDSHFVTSLGDLDNSLDIIKRANFPEELVLNTDIEKFESFVNFHKFN